jgi:hypothetical protein
VLSSSADMTEKRICIKFSFILKTKTAAKTHRMLQEAFGDNAMSQSKPFFVVQMLQGQMNVCR